MDSADIFVIIREAACKL